MPVDGLFPTCSLLFRNTLRREWPQWIGKVMSMDIALELMLAMHGTAVRIDMVMAAYRKHLAGITESMAHKRLGALRLLYLLKRFNGFSRGRYDETILERMRDISLLNLKLKELTSLGMLIHRWRLFSFHLYAVRASSFRQFRHEVYVHLIPETYQKTRALWKR